MKIGCLQFSPQLGQVDRNMQRADEILAAVEPSQLDLLVLPEMAFSGYNFRDLASITPFLEPTSAGPSTAWAKRTAARLKCVVNVGYPELAVCAPSSPATRTSSTSPTETKRYNTVVSISPDGQVLATYRKTFLYYTDETWASPGDGGFFYSADALGARLGPTCMGICMDINPQRFEAAWDLFEFAAHCVATKAPLVLLSMAWNTRASAAELEAAPLEPELETLAYWIERFAPLVKDESSETGTVLVLANRCGKEPGHGTGVLNDEWTCYAGTSTVLRVKGGKVQLYGILGKMEEKLLLVDTDAPPQFELKSRVT